MHPKRSKDSKISHLIKWSNVFERKITWCMQVAADEEMDTELIENTTCANCAKMYHIAFMREHNGR